MAPAERADVIVDFTERAGRNRALPDQRGPDEPFGGGGPESTSTPADPDTTGQVMKFRVVPRAGRGHEHAARTSSTLPALTPLGAASDTRQVSLNEVDSETVARRTSGPGRRCSARSTLGRRPDGSGPLRLGRPDHREPGAAARPRSGRCTTSPRTPTRSTSTRCSSRSSTGSRSSGGSARPPEPWETGFKDTVIAYPARSPASRRGSTCAGLLRLALPHRRARGQRDDAALRVGTPPTKL